MLPSRVRHTVKHGGPKPRPPWNGLDSPWFMNCDFANTEPLLPWDTLSSILVNGAQQVLGRTAPRLGAPYSPEDMHEITEMRNDLALLWSRLQNSDNAAEQQRLKHQHRMCNRQLQRFRSKARVRFVRTLCNEAEQHMRYHDMGRFYKSLKKRLVFIYQIRRVQAELRMIYQHSVTIVNLLVALSKRSPMKCYHMFHGARLHLGWALLLLLMRFAWLFVVFAIVPQGVTKSRQACSDGQDLELWIASLALYSHCGCPIRTSGLVPSKQGIGVYLHKKGDRQDLGNYRVIMLLPIISRVLARIVATRLQQWSEKEHFLHNFQWGFRPNRRCTDPALVLTLLLEMANAHTQVQEDTWDPLVLVLWDIVKAYPSTQRHLCWKLFHKLGVPEQLLRVLYGLHDCTNYVIRSGDEYSEPFSLAIGLREGCPSSPVCFFHFSITLQLVVFFTQTEAGGKSRHSLYCESSSSFSPSQTVGGES